MLNEVNVTSRRQVVVISKDEYDLLREAKVMLNQVCALYRDFKAGKLKYSTELENGLDIIVGEAVRMDTLDTTGGADE